MNIINSYNGVKLRYECSRRDCGAAYTDQLNAVHYITLLLPVLNTVCTANGQMYA